MDAQGCVSFSYLFSTSPKTLGGVEQGYPVENYRLVASFPGQKSKHLFEIILKN
jgi:hypothetical protein